MNKYKTLFNNTLIFFISEFASKILVFLLLPLYTRYLTTEQYGIVDLIATTVNLLLPIFTLCIAQAAMRFAMDEESDRRQIFSFGARVILLGFILLLASYPFLIRINNIEKYLTLLYMLYIASALDTQFSQFSKAINKVALVGISGVVKTVVMIGSNLILLVGFQLGITGYVVSTVLAHTASILFLFIGAKLYRYCTIKGTTKTYVGEMLRYSIPLIPNTLSWWLNNFASRYIILLFCGVGIQGMFAAASKIPVILATVQAIFISAWQLSAISEYKNPNRDEFYSRIYTLYNTGMVLCASVLIVLVRVIAWVLFAGEYYGAWIYIPLLLVSVVFGAMSGYLSTFFSASKQTGTLFSTTFIGGVSAVCVNFVLVPYFGPVGSSVAAVLSNVVVWAILLHKCKKFVNLDTGGAPLLICYVLLIIQAGCMMYFQGVFGYINSVVVLMIIAAINFGYLKFLLYFIIGYCERKLGVARIHE